MFIPADVPSGKKEQYQENLNTITRNSEHLFLFAGDQKIEHLNADFHDNFAHPEHLFKIAQQGDIGAFATQLGLIARYANQYREVNYIVKLNSKTDIIKQKETSSWWNPFFKKDNIDPMSKQMWSVSDVVTLKEESQLKIRGVGYTIYLGSEFESEMLTEAAQIIWQAHQHGLIAILWIYPRGIAVKKDDTLEMLSGAAGVANALGADVVKIKAPTDNSHHSAIEQLHIIKQAAGNTKVICSGGKQVDPASFLKRIEDQVHKGGIAGTAVGRNVFQHSLSDAIKMTKELSRIIYSR
jgi:fructose-bisphosphate aldolase/6-deoxy-5-ketofructose 1-phosphate synthase